MSFAGFFIGAGAPLWDAPGTRNETAGAVPHWEVALIVRPPQQPPQQEDKVRVNRKIRARQIRVIGEEGEQLGIMTPDEALRMAEGQNLDLVEVAPKAVPPVCRIMDYGKYRYDQKRRAREARKHQHTVSIKEIKFRPKIDKHDFEYKREHVRAFLEEGSKVKVTIMFRGREMAHPEFGKEILKRVVAETKELCAGEYDTENLRLEGRTMAIVLTPVKVAAPAAAPAAPKPQE